MAESLTEFDAHRDRWDVRFAVGDEPTVLLDTEHTPLPSRSLLSPRWMGPFKVLACPAWQHPIPIVRLDIPGPAARVWRICPEFNVERLRPYLRRGLA